MMVLPLTNLSSDIPYWVDRSVFFSHFDQDDFLNREVQAVQQAYLSEWFHHLEDGRVGFHIPVAGVIESRTDFIGTRHRLAVLLPHLEELPIAFATGHLSSSALAVIYAIPKRPLVTSELFWIPDLPVCDRLPL